MQVKYGLRSIVLTNHVVLINELMESCFNCVELIFQTVNKLLFRDRELLEFFFLNTQISLEHFCFGKSFIKCCLEFLVLSSENFYLPLTSLKLNFCIFCCKHLISMVTFNLKKLSICNHMVFLFFLIPLNPHFSGFLFTIDNLIEIGNLFIKLFLGELKLSLNSLLLCIECLIGPLEIHDSLVKFFNFLVFPHHGLLVELENLILAFAFLNLLNQLNLGLVADLVGQMQLLNGILEVLEGSVLLIFDLVMLDYQRAVLDIQFLVLGHCLIQFLLKFGNSLLSNPGHLIETDCVSLQLLEILGSLSQFLHQLTCFGFVTFA